MLALCPGWRRAMIRRPNMAGKSSLTAERRAQNGVSLRSRIACGGWIVILAILLVSVLSFSETEVETLLNSFDGLQSTRLVGRVDRS